MRTYEKVECPKCDRLFGKNNASKHILNCTGYKTCPVCQKKFVGSSKTCSYSCSNKHFRSGEDNGNWKQHAYRTTCWNYHQKKCIVCDEAKIVEVHHFNEDHNDHRPENLVPLCPTHHQYVHSRYKNEVLHIVNEYVTNFSRSPSLVNGTCFGSKKNVGSNPTRETNT